MSAERIAASVVDTGTLAELWKEFHRLRDHIAAALEYAEHTHTVEDVWALIAERRMQLWNGPSSVIVTEVVQHPQRRDLHFFLAGGRMQELQAMLPLVMRWGREQGCTKATMVGRRGWERSFLTRDLQWEVAPLVMLERDLFPKEEHHE